MTAAVLSRPATTIVPTPRVSAETLPRRTAAIAYEETLHRMVRREFRLLAELASWADAEDAVRATELTKHADLIARVLMQHHATERELLWPALFRHVPAGEQDAVRAVVAEWTSRAALLDHSLRDLSTVARQWAVATTLPARNAFVRALARLADTVETHTADEEADLHPLLARYLPDDEWTAVSRACRSSLSGREQMLVLGLALEDACAIDRARLLAGLPPTVRTAWRVVGRRNFRAAVVRLRGAPPAA
jgi:hemerythrin-like domain-containing protein